MFIPNSARSLQQLGDEKIQNKFVSLQRQDKKNNQNAELCTSEVEQQASYNSGHQKDLEA
jgi:hypothetical protein